MTAADKPIVGKIRKLLAKAEDKATTQPERESLLAKAQELMALHAVEEAEVWASTPADKRREEPGTRIVPLKKRDETRAGKAMLMQAVCDHTRCMVLNGDEALWVLGFPTDTEFAELLWTSLLLQMANDRHKAWSDYSGGMSRYKWVNGFAIGFAKEVSRRFNEMAKKREATVKKAEAATPGTALALVDRKDAVEKLYSELSGGPRQTRGRQVSSEGLAAGQAAGARADLSGGRNATSAATAKALQ